MKFISALLLFSAMLITPFAFPQTELIIQESKIVSEEVLDSCRRSDLQKGDFSISFFKQYANYSPQKEITDLIKNKIYSYSIIIVLGTWCGDSKEQVPRLFKILDNLDYNTNFIDMICVDRNKSSDRDIVKLKIERVPTFIFYKDGVEKGRITETPILTLEEDILHILNN